MKHLPQVNSRDYIRVTGTVYTPPEVAQALVRLALKGHTSSELRILEPSSGDGSFITGLSGLKPTNQFQLTAVDINALAIEQLRVNSSPEMRLQSTFIANEFLAFARSYTSNPFDLIVGNPPFISKKNYSDGFRREVAGLAEAAAYPAKYLRNSWAAFLLAAERLLAADGTLAFILPYEILTVSYGQFLLKYISEKFDRIDVFVPDEKAFPSIQQDAVAIVARRKAKRRGLFVNRVHSLANYKVLSHEHISYDTKLNTSLALKSFLLDDGDASMLQSFRMTTKTIGDYCESAPGVVTAANDFFILDKVKLTELGLSAWALPILRKGSFTNPLPIFSASDFTLLEASEPCYLISISEAKESLPAAVRQYIESGEVLGIHERYKCRNREPWYAVPLVKRTEAIFFKRSHNYPRICLNEASVHITDTAYGIRPKVGASSRGICFSFYNSMSFLFAEIDGRFYGGGVLELSPKEFRGLPMVYHEPTDREFHDFLNVQRTSKSDVDSLLDFGDGWMANKLNLGREQMEVFRRAWRIVRDHRLRHSGRVAHPVHPEDA